MLPYFPEADVRRDSQRYVQAIEDKDIGKTNHAVQLISGRSNRLAEVVRMDLREDAGSYKVEHVSQIGSSVERLLEKGTHASVYFSRQIFYFIPSVISIIFLEQRFCSLTAKAGSALESGKVNARALEEAAQKVW